MRTPLDDFMSVLGNHRDYVLLALAVLVLTEGAIIVLWARRATRLRWRLEDAVTQAERSAAAARAAAAVVNEQSQGVYRVAERMHVVDDSDVDSGRTSPLMRPLPPAPPHAEPAAAVPAPAAAAVPAPAAEHGAYTTPVAEQAAAWMLPEVEANVPAPAPAPTTLGWAGTPVPVEPASDFAVIGDAATVSRFTPRVHTSPPPTEVVAWTTPAQPSQPDPGNGRDAAIFDSNSDSGDAPEDLPDSGDILLVEDDATIAKLYSNLLESRGYSVRHAVDGFDGLDQANQHRPDLVLLDVMMPRMNGIAFLQALRSGPHRNVPVVVLSNFMEKQLVDDAMALGALEYMVKAQTRPEALAGALPHWLRGERAFSY